MTPAERAAKIKAAEDILNDVAADEQTQALPSFLTKNAAQGVIITPVVSPAPLKFPAKAVNPVTKPPAITGPGGDTRVSGQPSLLDTMKQVWAHMKGNK